MEITEQDRARFWGNVNKGVADECWTWKSATRRWDYGRFKLGGKTMGAHRASYIIHFGDIPEEKPYICHRCDNPNCVVVVQSEIPVVGQSNRWAGAVETTGT